jgi:hypothetical protein
MTPLQRKRAERWSPLVAAAAMLLLWQLVCSIFRIADFIFPSRTNSLRCRSASFGFGSKVSMCDGPPSIIRKMQLFAFVARCPGFGASGPADELAACNSRERRVVKATLPMLAPRL